MPDFYRDNDDLRFYVERGGIDWPALVEITELGFRTEGGFTDTSEAVQFYEDVLELVGQFAAEQVAPHAATIDATGVHMADGEVVFPPELDAIMAQIKDLEIHGMCAPRELGGQNCPLILYFVNTEVLARADVSVMAHHGFHGGMAMAMLLFSIKEGSTTFDKDKAKITSTRFGKEIAEILAGDAWGCMDITEPNAGSDMAALRTVGEQDDDGNWSVSGQKIFITSGHGKYHFVIARTEKAASGDDPFAGLNGLSMFLVPTYEEAADGTKRWLATVDRVEEKLGHHGSATAAITFDRTPAHLLGERGDGFLYMLTLMNNARLGVGFESIGLCEAALRAAEDYAAERASMGKPIARHEMIADYLDEMRTDIQGLRALAMYGAFHNELASKLELLTSQVLDEDDIERQRLLKDLRRHKRIARRVTPLLKYLAAEKAVEMARRSVQIHGGNGYMRDYPAERLLRDAMVMPIYEGTSQIQALMAMKDTLATIMKNPQRFVRRKAQARWRSLSARDPQVRALARIQALSLAAQQHLIFKTVGAKARSLPVSEWPRLLSKDWDPKRDFSHAMLHAERLTKLLTDEAIAEVLFEQAQEHPERADVFDRYVERAEPRCRFLHDEITTTGERIVRTTRGETATDTQRAAS